MHGVNIYHVSHVTQEMPCNQTQLEDGCWVIARPLGLTGFFWRLKCAWMVFRGKGDVITFTSQ